MTRSEESKKKQAAYITDYAKKHYKRVPLDVTFPEYEKIRAAASAAGESVNGYIKESVRRRMSSEEMPL